MRYSVKKTIIFVLLALLIISAAVFLIKGLTGKDSWICQNGQWMMHGHPSSPAPTAGCGEVSVSPEPSPSANPSSVVRGNLVLMEPYSGESVSSPIKVSGEVRVFESVVSLRLRDADGHILFDGIAMAQSPDMGQFGPFEREIAYLYQKPTDTTVWLDVFWNSPKDGSEMDLISIPLTLVNLDNALTVNVYFSNDRLDPAISCNKVFPVQRVIPYTQSVARKTLEALLGGVGLKEAEQGYSTSINPGVGLKSLNLANGVARADFDETLDRNIGGSCRVTAIRAQITETLKQFPTVKDVIISVNGRTEDILQP